MAIELIPFKPEHIDLIDLRAFDEERLSRWPSIKKTALYLPQSGPCYSGVIDNEIIGAGGFIKLWP